MWSFPITSVYKIYPELQNSTLMRSYILVETHIPMTTGWNRLSSVWGCPLTMYLSYISTRYLSSMHFLPVPNRRHCTQRPLCLIQNVWGYYTISWSCNHCSMGPGPMTYQTGVDQHLYTFTITLPLKVVPTPLSESNSPPSKYFI